MTVMRLTRNLASEYALSACLLTDAVVDALNEEGVTPVMHEQPHHRAVHQAMLELRNRGEPVDRVTLAQQLVAGPFDAAAAAGLVDRLCAPVPALGELRSYCRLIVTEYEWERRARLLDQAGRAIHGRDADAFTAALTGMERPAAGRDTSLSPEDLLSDFCDYYDSSDQAAIPLPFDRLNRLLRGGLRPGDTTVLGGWPAHGKTALASQIVLHAHQHGASCHEYVNEMSATDRTARMLARLTGIRFDRIITRQLDTASGEVAKVLKAGQQLPAGMTPCSGWSAEDIARQVRRRKDDLAVIDLVTRIPARDTADWDRVSGTLTDAARQSGTHLILVSQLNLERCKTAIRPSPTGRDLRNTGAWYQDARVVMFVHRDQELVDGTDVAEVLDDGHVRIEKATSGQPGIQPVRFDAARMSFTERPTGLRAVA